jgi:DNA-binding transcriptional ArsR family regulator
MNTTTPPAPVELADDWAPRFHTLSDRTRLRLLITLHYHGAQALAVGELAALTGVSFTAASSALRLMAASGVLRVERVGKTMRYSLADEQIHQLLHHLGGTHAHP